MGASVIVGIAGSVASLLALAISALSVIRRRRRRHAHQKLPTIQSWRLANYQLALKHLKDMIQRWERREFDPQSRRGFVTEYDLVRWIFQLALTSAASIVPQSLGKASLFRIGEIQRDSEGRLAKVRVYSFELDGVFSAEQMLDGMDPRRMRDISIGLDGQNNDVFPAALQCVRDKTPIVQSLRLRASKFDSPERRLGLTHILAIPLRSDLQDALQDQPVSITVDLRYRRLAGYLVDHAGLHHDKLIERATDIAQALGRVGSIHKPEFLPPPAPDRGERGPV